jgi:hypothetical protein
MDHKINASFKGGDGVDRGKFKEQVCFLPISVGMLNHEGKKFEATLRLVNKNFKKCIIQIDDTIQRHTLRIVENLTDQDAFIKSKTIGDEWIKRNRISIDSLTIDYEILRWFSWTENENFGEALKKIEELYQCNDEYRKDMNINADEFLKRRSIRYNDERYLSKMAYELCINYLKEECAVMLLWSQMKYDIELYPTGRNQSMEMTYKKMIEPFDDNVLKSVELRFKKTKKTLKKFNKRMVSMDEIAITLK